MAICTDLFLGNVGKEGFVLLGVDFVFWVAAHTERINLCPGIHYIGRGTVSAGGPGFVGDVVIALAVAVRTAHIGPCMGYGDILLNVVKMTDETAAVIGHGTGRRGKLFLAIVKKQ